MDITLEDIKNGIRREEERCYKELMDGQQKTYQRQQDQICTSPESIVKNGGKLEDTEALLESEEESQIGK